MRHVGDGVLTPVHGLLDQFFVNIGSTFAPTAFRDGIETPPIDAHIEATSIELPHLGPDSTYAIPVAGLVEVPPAQLRVGSQIRDGRPTVIYHHGIGEHPFDASFDRILRPDEPALDANLIAIGAPFHGSLERYHQGLASLGRTVALQAASVALIEAVRDQLEQRLGGPTVVTGTSLGGFVTNLHHIHFGTADRYVPMLAGLAEDDVFLDSPFRLGVDRSARAAGDYLADRLNFSGAFADCDPEGVHPLLARQDRIVRYDVQAASYNGRPIATLDSGHLTGTTMATRLRCHLKQFVERAAEAA